MQMNSTHLHQQQSARRTEALLRSRGLKRSVSTRVIEAALAITSANMDERVLGVTKEFFSTRAVFVPHGLEDVPKIWLSQLPHILWESRKAHWHHLPYMITSVTFKNGLLCFSFSQEAPSFSNRISGWDRLRVLVNSQLRPNIFEPLPIQIERQVWDRFRELRDELFQV
jgi:hypothetical protein